MACVTQEDKKELAPAIKAVLKKYGMQGTIGVRHHSTLVVNIKSGPLDIIGVGHESQLVNARQDLECNPYDCLSVADRLADKYRQVNEYWIGETYESNPTVVAFLTELVEAMKGPKYFCEDDSMTDYFFRSHYTDINVGGWSKPYVCTGETKDWSSKIEELKAKAEELFAVQKAA